MNFKEKKKPTIFKSGESLKWQFNKMIDFLLGALSKPPENDRFQHLPEASSSVGPKQRFNLIMAWSRNQLAALLFHL